MSSHLNFTSELGDTNLQQQQLCLSYNSSVEPCPDNTSDSLYERCAKRIHCPFDEGHACYVVWRSNLTTLFSGCHPGQQAQGAAECHADCTGKLKGGDMYHCCCIGNLCNRNFHLPPQPLVTEAPTVSPKVPSKDRDDGSQQELWSVIPILLIVIFIFGVYIYHRKRLAKSQVNRRNNRSNGMLNERELNEMRVNQDVSITMAFQNLLGDENCFNINNNNNNNSNNHKSHGNSHLIASNSNQQALALPMTNHRDANRESDIRIDLNSVKLLEVVGSGRFGKVHRATIENGHGTTEVAVKVISNGDYQSWLNEQQIYNSPKIKHPNILGFLCSDEHFADGYWLVVEYASKGSLYKFLNYNVISWEEFIKIALGIVHGLSHLHEADIAHRDFKSKNILLKQDLTPCIIDFGVAAILESTSSGQQLDQRKKYLQVGTPRYMAPEVLECSVTFTKASFTKIDVYALSLVLWELLSRCHPLPEGAGFDVDRNRPGPFELPFEDIAGPCPDVIKMRQIVVVDKLRPVFKEHWRAHYPASEFCRAIEDGWEYDHDARISASCFVERVEEIAQNVQCLSSA